MATTFGKYAVERELGRGAMGIAYLATDRTLGRQVALKVLVIPHTMQGMQRTGLIQRFQREARVVAAVDHPVVPRIFDVGAVGDQHYIAMEYCRGQTLKETLQRKGPMPPNVALGLVQQLLSGLGAAHALGICHRDVKPENVMLGPDHASVKLMDFGIARMQGDLSLTGAGAILGTPSYMSPEQLSGAEVDGRADLFATGILLHELVAGARPFAGDSLVEIAYAIGHLPPNLSPSLPPELLPVIGKALAKNPAERFQSAEEMASALFTGVVPDAAPAASAGFAPFAPLDQTILLYGPQIGGTPFPVSSGAAGTASDPYRAPAPAPGSPPASALTPMPPAGRGSQWPVIGAAVACVAAAAFLLSSFGWPWTAPTPPQGASAAPIPNVPAAPGAGAAQSQVGNPAPAPVAPGARVARSNDFLRGTPWDPGPNPWAHTETPKAAARKPPKTGGSRAKLPPPTANPRILYVDGSRRPGGGDRVQTGAPPAAPAPAFAPPATPVASPAPAVVEVPAPALTAPARLPEATVTPPAVPAAAPPRVISTPAASAPAPAPRQRFSAGSDREIYTIQPDIALQYGIRTGKPIPMPDRYGYWYKTISPIEAFRRYDIRTTFPIPDPAIYGKPPVSIRRIPVPEELR